MRKWHEKYISKYLNRSVKSKSKTNQTKMIHQPSGNSYSCKIHITVEGSEQVWFLEHFSKSSAEKLKDHLEWEEIDGELWFNLKKGHDKYTKSTRTVLYCSYNATEDYIKSMIGGSLSLADKDWFRDHPLVDSQGLPTEYTIGVLNELVKPYNLGVSRVFVKKKVVLTQDMRDWMAALGVNPKAAVDRDVSNKEFLELLAAESKEAADMYAGEVKNWRFEFCDDLPKGGYIMFRHSEALNAPGGGHASFSSPRSFSGNFFMAIQLDRLNNITYLEEPPSKDYSTPAAATSKLDFYKSIVDDGKSTVDDVTIKASSGGGYNGYSGYKGHGEYSGNYSGHHAGNNGNYSGKSLELDKVEYGDLGWNIG